MLWCATACLHTLIHVFWVGLSSSWVHHFAYATCNRGTATLVSQVIANPVGNQDMGRPGAVRLLAEFQSAAIEGNNTLYHVLCVPHHATAYYSIPHYLCTWNNWYGLHWTGTAEEQEDPWVPEAEPQPDEDPERKCHTTQHHNWHDLNVVHCCCEFWLVINMLEHATTGLSAREAYYDVQHCSSAQGIDAGTLRSACEVQYDPTIGSKRKTIEEAQQLNLLRPQKVMFLTHHLLEHVCVCFRVFFTCYNMLWYEQVSKEERMKDVYSCRDEKELHNVFLAHNLSQKACNDILKIVKDVSTTLIMFEVHVYHFTRAFSALKHAKPCCCQPDMLPMCSLDLMVNVSKSSTSRKWMKNFWTSCKMEICTGKTSEKVWNLYMCLHELFVSCTWHTIACFSPLLTATPPCLYYWQGPKLMEM